MSMFKWNLVRTFSLVAIVAATALAEDQPVRSPDPTYEELHAQIDLARSLRLIDLSKEQVIKLQKIAVTVAESSQKLKQFRTRADVKAALAKVRDAALTGATDDAMWTAYDQFSDEADQLEKNLEDAVENATKEALAILSTTQVSRLLLDQATTPGDVLDDLGEHRGDKPDDWRQWRDETCRSLANEASGKEDTDPPAELVKNLSAFFDRLRNMPTDDFFTKRDTLIRELRATLLESIGQVPEEARHEKATDTLKEWFANEHFPALLKRLVELIP